MIWRRRLGSMWRVWRSSRIVLTVPLQSILLWWRHVAIGHLGVSGEMSSSWWSRWHLASWRVWGRRASHIPRLWRAILVWQGTVAPGVTHGWTTWASATILMLVPIVSEFSWVIWLASVVFSRVSAVSLGRRRSILVRGSFHFSWVCAIRVSDIPHVAAISTTVSEVTSGMNLVPW